MEPLTAKALRGMGARPAFLAVDPGATCGTGCYGVGQPNECAASSRALGDLTAWLSHFLLDHHLVGFVVCENYTQTGRHAEAKMSAPQGIGICRAVCDIAGLPLYLLPRGSKTAGRAALDADGQDARARCRNEHQRDIVDLIGFTLREMGRPA